MHRRVLFFVIIASLAMGVVGQRGSRAINVTPALKDGHSIASVTLLTGQQFQTVEQLLE
jgi:hypothetical protein